ncbi:beta-galactosidase [Planomonospora parontospora]|uniref:beta-galactosidase n=1 Tax=Planomonospora parontospora TaxID=58119 RepID=UPI001991A307|nr:beta-galactosidase [Planomonospora parontospora]GGL05019.1 beta-galactosidase [Planomonospora parontospora subsp. antibiotica]GII14372.1 beta-galactosidase [Planomonospora parontospora subsp. antibiotica]
MNWPKGLEGLCYGGDYNPEQWPEKVWEEDVALMRQAGVNLVSVGVFSWARLEPAEGAYDFGWLDRVLDLLHGGGVRVNLATPTASPPPWFSLAHPDALAVTADGVRLTHGSRDTYCVTAPAYREASVRIARALAERYAGHPALAMWHVHNEYGTGCHCDHAAAAFRAWLRARHGSLEALNDAWTTSFWSQHYSAWEQVMPPRATQYLPNPAQVLDFRRFLSDELLAHFREQKAVLRELTPDVPVTTNFVFGDWVPVNQWDWAKEVDLVAIDHYPAQNPPEETAFAADLARGWAGGRPWLLMEQAVVTYTGPRMAAKRPGEITRLSLSHIARGSRGAMFFQWRASRGGAELWHGGMVPHSGPDSRIFREIRDLGALLPALAEACEAPVEASAAILWDPESGWALQSPGFPSTEVGYLEAVRQAHRVLYRHGVTADFARPSADLSAYELVIAPSLYLLSDDDADNLRRYAAGGGRLVVSFLSGIADGHARVRTGGYPGALRDLLGVRVEEFLPIADPVTLDDGATATLWTEHVHLAGAEALARYPDGTPAVTRRGRAVYVSTRLDDDAYARLLGLGPAAPVESVRRGDWVFSVNHGDREQAIPGNLLLPPGGYAVARVPR